ncbi:MAG: glycosyltransferase, partial [Pirellulales bacterium]|nr:glycosyltransferase [Pirellulales bacterium]
MAPKKTARSGFRFACTGTYVPRQCGIATFTHDLCNAVCEELRNPDACQVIALNDSPERGPYPARVRFEIRQEEAADYRLAADFVNMRGAEMLLVQHEYGIFGGEAGNHLLGMLRDISVPVVTTMHTVLREPGEAYRRATRQLVELSDRIVVMADRAVGFLQEVYGVSPEKIAKIPHGIPDMPFVDPAYFKDQFGVEGRKVLLTFGLLSPNKGVENVIRALPEIVRNHPEVIYIVLGATHPHVRKARGEEYRHELQRLAEELGVLEH